MSNAFVTIKMCYVYNQWYDISCGTLYVFNLLYVFSGNKKKWLTARMHGVESFKITPWSTVLFEELRVLQLVKNIRYFMEPEVLLQHPQQSATCPYSESDEFSPVLSYLFKIHFNIILQYKRSFPKRSLSFRFSRQTSCAFLFSPMVATRFPKPHPHVFI